METLLLAVVQGIMMGSVYALIATGLTMVFTVTKLLNFAHGDLMVLAMYVCLALYAGFGLDPYVSIVITLPLMLGLGFLIFYFLIKPVLRASFLMVIQLTLGMVFIIENGLRLIFTANYQTVPTFISASKVYFGPVIIETPVFIAFLVSASIAIIFYWVLKYTDFGRAIRVIGHSPETAALMGINLRRVQMIVFAVGIMLLGPVGPLVIPKFAMEPYMGLHMTLFCFIILVVGGAGNFLGALVGGLVIGVAESVGYLYVGTSMAPALPYAIFILILLFRPQGLLGEM